MLQTIRLDTFYKLWPHIRHRRSKILLKIRTMRINITGISREKKQLLLLLVLDWLLEKTVLSFIAFYISFVMAFGLKSMIKFML